MKFGACEQNLPKDLLTKFQVNMTTWCWHKHFFCHVIKVKNEAFLLFTKSSIKSKIQWSTDDQALKLCLTVNNKSKYLYESIDDVTVKNVYFTDQKSHNFYFLGVLSYNF